MGGQGHRGAGTVPHGVPGSPGPTPRPASRVHPAAGLTPGHLNDLTKATTGQTASDLIDARLILEAKRLLAHSDALVAEIAADLGFPAPSSFGRFFRRHVGQSPGALRATIRKKHQDHR